MSLSIIKLFLNIYVCELLAFVILQTWELLELFTRLSSEGVLIQASNNLESNHVSISYGSLQ